MFVPPIQAHTDAVVILDTVESHAENLDEAHQDEHHKNDSEEHKNTKHHHHCSAQSITSSFINNEIQFHFHNYFSRKECILFYNRMNASNFIETPIEPPRFS